MSFSFNCPSETKDAISFLALPAKILFTNACVDRLSDPGKMEPSVAHKCNFYNHISLEPFIWGPFLQLHVYFTTKELEYGNRLIM